MKVAKEVKREVGKAKKAVKEKAEKRKAKPKKKKS